MVEQQPKQSGINKTILIILLLIIFTKECPAESDGQMTIDNIGGAFIVIGAGKLLFFRRKNKRDILLPTFFRDYSEFPELGFRVLVL